MPYAGLDSPDGALVPVEKAPDVSAGIALVRKVVDHRFEDGKGAVFEDVRRELHCCFSHHATDLTM
jgi:hypothetical protein